MNRVFLRQLDNVDRKLWPRRIADDTWSWPKIWVELLIAWTNPWASLWRALSGLPTLDELDDNDDRHESQCDTSNHP